MTLAPDIKKQTVDIALGFYDGINQIVGMYSSVQ
jgi:hypothetical protein